MKITDEQIKFFKEAKKTIAKGYFPSGVLAIRYYNEIFAEEIAEGKMRGNLSPKCGGCIRQSVQKVNEALNKLEKQMEDEERVERQDSEVEQGTDKEG